MRGWSVAGAAAVSAVLVLAAPAGALRLAVSTGKPVAINLEVGTPSVVIFPKPIVAIPTSASKDAVSLEVLGGNMLFVQLLERDYESTMFVVTSDRQMHMLTLRETPPGLRADTQVQLLQTGVGGNLEAASPAPPGVVVPEAPAPGAVEDSPLRSLLTHMMGGTRTAGMRHVPMAQVLIERLPLTITARHGFLSGGFLGMIAEATNDGEEVFYLRLPEFQAAGLRAIAAEHEAIAPGGSVMVWLVVEVPARTVGRP